MAIYGCDCCCCARCDDDTETFTGNVHVVEKTNPYDFPFVFCEIGCPCAEAVPPFPILPTDPAELGLANPCLWKSDVITYCAGHPDNTVLPGGWYYTFQVYVLGCGNAPGGVVTDTYLLSMYARMSIYNASGLYQQDWVKLGTGLDYTNCLGNQCHCLYGVAPFPYVSNPARVYGWSFCFSHPPDIGTPTNRFLYLVFCVTLDRDADCDCSAICQCSSPPPPPPSSPPKFYCMPATGGDCISPDRECLPFAATPVAACSGPYDTSYDCVQACGTIGPSFDPTFRLAFRGGIPLDDPILAHGGPTVHLGVNRRAAIANTPDPENVLPPTTTTKIDLTGLPAGARFGEQFNGSMLAWNGRTILAYRVDWAPEGRTYLVELDGDRKPIGPAVLLQIEHSLADAQEDPRLFVFRGRLHVSFTGVTRPDGDWMTYVLYARLNDAFEVEEVFAPTCLWLPTPRMEKNWVFFEYEGELYCVYSGKPNHVVFHVAGEVATVVADEPNHLPWSGGVWHGGASPVRVGDRFVHWFHGREGRANHYNVGVVEFEAKPPFRLLRGTPDPLFWADRNSNPGNHYDVIFPGSASLDGDVWTITAGLHDRTVEVLTWPASAVEAAMVSVPNRPVMGRIELSLRPACQWEGPVVTYCTSCGSDGPKGEERHVRHCLHPSDARDFCTRNIPDGEHQSCSTCLDYQAAGGSPNPDHLSRALASEIGLTTDLPGWCSPEKARNMAVLVVRERPTVVVEIGVFGGRSFLPMAMAVRANGVLESGRVGCVIGIDPYDNAAAVEGFEPGNTHYEWWAETDLVLVKHELQRMIQDRKLKPWAKLVVDRSENVVIPTVDILHIDGNHATQAAARDVRIWLPRVRPGGWVWIDDVDSAEVLNACELLEAECDLVENYLRKGDSAAPYRLYQRRPPRDSHPLALDPPPQAVEADRK